MNFSIGEDVLVIVGTKICSGNIVYIKENCFTVAYGTICSYLYYHSNNYKKGIASKCVLMDDFIFDESKNCFDLI